MKAGVDNLYFKEIKLTGITKAGFINYNVGKDPHWYLVQECDATMMGNDKMPGQKMYFSATCDQSPALKSKSVAVKTPLSRFLKMAFQLPL